MAVKTHGQFEVDVAPLRRAFIRSGRRPTDVAYDLGWRRCDGYPDASRVKRTLGIYHYYPGHGYPPRLAERCSYDTAVAMAHVLGLDPIEMNI